MMRPTTWNCVFTSPRDPRGRVGILVGGASSFLPSFSSAASFDAADDEEEEEALEEEALDTAELERATGAFGGWLGWEAISAGIREPGTFGALVEARRG